MGQAQWHGKGTSPTASAGRRARQQPVQARISPADLPTVSKLAARLPQTDSLLQKYLQLTGMWVSKLFDTFFFFIGHEGFFNKCLMEIHHGQKM